MSPKMEAALRAARRSDEQGGLCYTTAGWIEPKDCWAYHNFIAVSKLVQDGYLAGRGPKSGPRQRRVITDFGRAYLADAKEQPA